MNEETTDPLSLRMLVLLYLLISSSWGLIIYLFTNGKGFLYKMAPTPWGMALFELRPMADQCFQMMYPAGVFWIMFIWHQVRGETEEEFRDQTK